MVMRHKITVYQVLVIRLNYVKFSNTDVYTVMIAMEGGRHYFREF